MPTPYTHTYSPLSYIGSKRTLRAKGDKTAFCPVKGDMVETVPLHPVFARLEDFYDVFDVHPNGTASPKGDHKDYQYREPFFGGGNVGLRFAGRYNLSSVWLNDYDPGTAAYWNAVLNEPDALIRKITRNKPTEAKFDKLLKQFRAVCATHKKKKLNPSTMPTKDLIELAFMKHAANLWSFGGKGMQFCPDAIEYRGVANPTNTLIPRIHAAHETLSSVNLYGGCITCLDWSEVVNAPGESFVYCDPPYTQAEQQNLYPFPFRESDHRAIVRALKRRQNWALSYDFSPTVMKYLDAQVFNEKGDQLHLETVESKNSINTLGERDKEEVFLHD